MDCPSTERDVLSQILRQGLLQIRCLANMSAPDSCARIAASADHLHNLSGLIHDFDPELLRLYWDVERPTFRQNAPASDLARFEGLWERLEPLIADQRDVPGPSRTGQGVASLAAIRADHSGG